jgi:transcriptional regulator with XRE-family HTH domain
MCHALHTSVFWSDADYVRQSQRKCRGKSAMMDGVAARLREERQKKALNQERFGELGGVGRHSQAEYESGKTAPNTDYLLRLAGHGVDIGYVLTGERKLAALSARETAIVAAYRSLTSDWQAILEKALLPVSGNTSPTMARTGGG